MKKMFVLLFLVSIVPVFGFESVDSIKGFRSVKFGDNVRSNPDFVLFKLQGMTESVDLGIMVNPKDNLIFDGVEFESIEYSDYIKGKNEHSVHTITLRYSTKSASDLDSFYCHFVNYYSKQFGKGTEEKTNVNNNLEKYQRENSELKYLTIWKGKEIELKIEKHISKVEVAFNDVGEVPDYLEKFKNFTTTVYSGSIIIRHLK